MQLIRKFRIPALFCALAVLLCELISHPYANMGICDDWPYILMVQKLAATGHVVYNGWAAPMLTWQLYLGAALVKLFGFSSTTVRMSTLLVALALAFVLQRTLVRANISERNATIGTLALVLSPLYLMLSATFMTDIHGLFAILLCLYGCLRALQASTSRAAISWLCFAVATNAICGTSRQIAWLGIFVMVPSALWLLRARRRVLLAGVAVTLAGALFIFGCLHWLKRQPYSIPEHVLPTTFPIAHISLQVLYACLDVPFLLFPIVVLFLPTIRKIRPRTLAILSALLVGYLFLALYPSHIRGSLPLEPISGSVGEWVNAPATFAYLILQGTPPAFLHRGVQALLTIATLGGLLGLIASFFLSRRNMPPVADSSITISWQQLGVLLVPFTLAYTFLLLPRAATTGLHDRYFLGLLIGALLCLVRYYQERIQLQMPFASFLLIGIMAIYFIAVTHNMFALYRARVAMAAELSTAGVPDTSVDNGWEYNFGVELHHADHLNLSTIAVPANAYVPTPALPASTCPMNTFEETPHIHPLYGISFDPNACYGLASFAPVHYSRWPASTPGTLYVVRYTATPAH
jgi:Dolichyl-phosphate-mannose-protein mannosyltransferase